MPPKGRGSLEPWLRDEIEFYPHQIEGVRILSQRRSFILGDDMGLGKSLEAIATYCIDIVRGIAKKAIIVCPVSLKENWLDEFEKFTRIPAVVVSGSVAKRTKQIKDFGLLDGPGALILNYEQVKKHVVLLNRIQWDVAILDEAHAIKTPDSERTIAVHRIKATRYFMLTGTPVLNNVGELWSLFHLIDRRRWHGYWQFVNEYCVFGGFKGQQIVGVKNEKELQDYLSEVMLRRLSSEVLPLKDPIPITRFVTMGAEQQKLYDQVKEELYLIDPETGEEKDIDNALTKFLRLKQICGTTLTFTGQDESAKFDRAIIDSKQIFDSGNKGIIFSQFRDTIDAYRSRLEAIGIPTWTITGSTKAELRTSIVKDWGSDPRPGVILCMLQVAGVGLNMTSARYVQFLDSLYTPGLNKQAIARANRIGQDITKAVIVVKYLTRNSVEQRIEEILSSKDTIVKNVVEAAAINSESKREFLKLLKEKM